MAVRPILTYPDSRLRVTARPVPKVDDRVRSILHDMRHTMYDAPGIGLAGPQIGEPWRLVVMDCARDGEGQNLRMMANPEILDASDETDVGEEGCLSLPDILVEVRRSVAVRARYLDETGAVVERGFSGLEALCLQHEIDHLDGRLILDSLSALKRRLITQRLRKRKRGSSDEADG